MRSSAPRPRLGLDLDPYQGQDECMESWESWELQGDLLFTDVISQRCSGHCFPGDSRAEWLWRSESFGKPLILLFLDWPLFVLFRYGSRHPAARREGPKGWIRHTWSVASHFNGWYVVGLFKSNIIVAFLVHLNMEKDGTISNFGVAHPTKIPCREPRSPRLSKHAKKHGGLHKISMATGPWRIWVCLRMIYDIWYIYIYPKIITLPGKRMINHDKPPENMGDHILRQTHVDTCFIFCHHVSHSLGSFWSSVQLFLHEATLQGREMNKLRNTFQLRSSDFDVFCQLESCQLTQLRDHEACCKVWKLHGWHEGWGQQSDGLGVPCSAHGPLWPGLDPSSLSKVQPLRDSYGQLASESTHTEGFSLRKTGPAPERSSSLCMQSSQASDMLCW